MLAGFGLGIGSPGTVASVSVRVGPELLGSVSGLMTLTATLANALGMASLFAVVEANGGVNEPARIGSAIWPAARSPPSALWAAHALLQRVRRHNPARTAEPGAGMWYEALVSEAVTQGVRVKVQSTYVPEQSTPRQQRYVFAYTIRITNEGERPRS